MCVRAGVRARRSLDLGHSTSSRFFDPAFKAAHWEHCNVNMCVSLQRSAACLALRSCGEHRIFLGAAPAENHMMDGCVFSRESFTSVSSFGTL